MPLVVEVRLLALLLTEELLLTEAPLVTVASTVLRLKLRVLPLLTTCWVPSLPAILRISGVSVLL